MSHDKEHCKSVKYLYFYIDQPVVLFINRLHLCPFNYLKTLHRTTCTESYTKSQYTKNYTNDLGSFQGLVLAFTFLQSSFKNYKRCSGSPGETQSAVNIKIR